ncbi:MAG: hypothetical protein J5636_07150 [Clostridiales bacterium]|nr:hypothetical protein [Clostridiales bacterium]
MEVLYWTIGILMGASTGIGIAFFVMAALLKKSNSIGDSKTDDNEFSSGIAYLAQENNISHNQQLFTNFVESNLEAMMSSREYATRLESALRGNPKKLVERYIPGAEDEEVSDPNEMSGVIGVNSKMGVIPSFSPLLRSSSFLAAANRDVRTGAAPGSIVLTTGIGNGAVASSGSSASPIGQAASPASGDEIVTASGVKIKRDSQAQIDAFWGTPAKKTSSEAPSAGVSTDSATPDISPDTTSEASPVDEPIYEAPTAHRPLWLNSNPDDDFSDFEDM